MIYLVAVLLIIAGGFSVLVGIIASRDPEGRGGALWSLIPIGAISSIGGIALLANHFLGLLI